jgi:hypothetical protein
VLPDLFPTADPAIFSSTIDSLKIESPPPRETSRVATDFSALGAVQSADFFSRPERHRVLLLITDGESAAFDAGAVARTLASAPSVYLVVVRVGAGGDRLYASDGRPGAAYRADPEEARRAVSQLIAATNGRSFSAASGVAAALRTELGRGRSTTVTAEPQARTLAPFVVLLALVPWLLARARSARGARGRAAPAG